MTPRLILEVRGGKGHGTKVVVDPGARVRVGRTDLADIVVPHDPLLNGVHFELTWDGERAFVKDRRTMKGTQVGGLPVTKSEVPHGGWIRAGNTDFMVYVEAKTPARSDEEEEEALADLERREREVRRAAAEGALGELRREVSRTPLFAIVDAARDGRILQILRESVEKHQSLYEGVDGEALEHVAPYLVGPMRADSTCLDRLVREGWGKRWGIYVTSRESFREVRRHFRRFLMVDVGDSDDRLYFRYYDPEPLAAFLASCTERQRDSFFALVDDFVAERRSIGSVAAGVVRFSRADRTETTHLVD